MLQRLCCAIPLHAAAGIGGGALSAIARYLTPGADLFSASLRSFFCTPSPHPDEPSVCTADLSDAPTVQGQLDGYRAAFAHLLRIERFPSGVRWVFAKRPGLDAELRRLAEKEHQCCKFFRFDLLSTDDAIVWETTATEEASSVLEEFGRLPERLNQHPKGEDMSALKEKANGAGLVFAADE